MDFNFQDILGNSAFQVGYPLGLALLSATGQRGANAAYGLNTGLGIANRFNQQQKQDEQNKLLGQSLGSLLKSTTPVSTPTTVAAQQVNPSTASYEMPDTADNQAAVPQRNSAQSWRTAMAGAVPSSVPLERVIKTSEKPIFSPQAQKLGDALINAGRGDALLPIIARQVIKEQQAPHTFGNAELGMFRLDENGQPVPLVPGVGRREATPPRPVFATQGGEGVQSVYNKDTGQWETQRAPLTAAPARQMSPEEADLQRARLRNEQARTGLIGAQTQNARSESDVRVQRLQNLKELASKANDPRTTAGQASAALNALLRERDSLEADFYSPEEKQNLNDAIKGIRNRLAELGRSQGAQGQPAAANPNDPLGIRPPGKAVGKTRSGQLVYEDENGKRWVQDTKTLDATTAAQILKEAGGDKNKAREIARQRGYQF